MRITIQVLDRDLFVDVGEGHQTVRWLAQVIQSRIAARKLMRLEFAEDRVIVTAIRSSSGAIISPNSLISEVLSDDSTSLRADVADSIPTDEHGNPVPTQWTQDAYIKSAAGRNFFQGNKGWKRNPSRMRTPGTRGGRSGAAGLMSADGLVFVGNMTESDVLTAFELDWPQIDWGFALQDASMEELDRLKDGVMRCYEVICRLFQHYAGLGQAGQRYGITLNDFARLLHGAGLSNYAAGMKRLEIIFSKSVDGGLPGDKEGAGPGAAKPFGLSSTATTSATATAAATTLPPGHWAVMSRPEFVQALARVALLGERQDVIRDGGVDLILRNFHRLVAGPLVQYWFDLERSREVYRDDGSRDLFCQAHRLLQSVFQSSSTIDARLGPAMSFAAFENVIKGTGLYIDRLSFIKKIEDIFYIDSRAVGSKVDVVPIKGLNDTGAFGSAAAGPASQASRSKPTYAEAAPPQREFEDVTFSEFCEAIMRALPVALAKDEDFADDLDRKRMGLRKLASSIAPPSTAPITDSGDVPTTGEGKPTTSAGDRAGAKSSQGRK